AVAVLDNDKSDAKSVIYKKPKKKSTKKRNGISVQKKEKSKKKKNDRKERKLILSMETGLDRGLIPKRIRAINEYQGIILHEIEWTDSNEEPELIPSPILSAKYPQIVIQFYESCCFLFNVQTKVLKKVF
ncbi:chromobox-like protein 5, partial [Leptotrombidium deliense]